MLDDIGWGVSVKAGNYTASRLSKAEDVLAGAWQFVDVD